MKCCEQVKKGQFCSSFPLNAIISMNNINASKVPLGIAKSPDLEIIKVPPELLKNPNRIQTHQLRSKLFSTSLGSSVLEFSTFHGINTTRDGRC